MLALIASSGAFAAEYNGTFPRRVPAPTDRVIIKWRATAELAVAGEVAQDRVARLAAATGVRATAMRRIAPRLELLRLEQPLSGAALEQALAGLTADPAVEYAVPDERRWPHVIPSDALFSGQWYLQAAQAAATRTSTAWDTTTGSTGTVVAILDTGVRFEHPDLGRAEQAGKLLPGYDFVAANAGSVAIANDGDGRDPDPSDPGDWIDAADVQDPEFAGCEQTGSSWHGTRVAGIVGARTDNGIGIAGESWNAWILPLRVLGKCGGFDSDILSAMRWAAGFAVSGTPSNPYPAEIINLSLGSASSCPQSYIDVVGELATRGVLVVASSGNDGSVVNAPANCPGVLAVSAVRHIGTKVGFSSLGPLVGISAPGGNCVNLGPPCLFSIDTAVDAGLTGPAGSTYTNQVDFNVGTSFSAPMVASAAALMHAVNARLGPALLTARLKSAAAPFPVPTMPPAGGTCHVPTGPNDVQLDECTCTTLTCGAGMLDASAAVIQALRPIASIVVPGPVVAGQNVSLDGSSSAAACNRSLSTYAWTIAPGSAGSPAIAGADQPIAMVLAPTSGSFTLRLTITDNSGAQDFADVTVTPSNATTTAIAPLAGNACPTPITVQQTPPPPPGGGGGGGNGGGGGGALALELLALALAISRSRQAPRP
jgi:serine protease